MNDPRFKTIYDFRDQDIGTATQVDIALRKLNYIGNYLALGDSIGSHAILSSPYIIENKDRIVAMGVNKQLEATGPWRHMNIYHGDANSMSYIQSGSQDVVLCCMMLEHDRFFWKTLSEVRRVLRPGGIFLLTVPVYLVNDREELVDIRIALTENRDKTSCYRVHGEDYYRFSLDSIAEVLMEGFVDKHLVLYQDPPRALCYGTRTI